MNAILIISSFNRIFMYGVDVQSMRSVTLSLLCLMMNCALAQSVDLSNWKLDSIPMNGRLIAANNSKTNWMFLKKEGKYIVVENDFTLVVGDDFPFQNEMSFPVEFQSHKFERVFKLGNKKVKKVEDGYIVGTNNGEFLSGLFFVGNNVSNRNIIGFGLRIHYIYELQSKLYAIEGLAHLGMSNGSVIEIFKDSVWTYKQVLKLEDAPNLILKDRSGILILTSQFLYRQTADKVEKILKSPFYWGMLYPSSMVRDDKDLYFAMRQGVLKIVSFEYNPTYEWYVPK